MVLRSLTKDLALAGVRVGYAITSNAIAQVLQRVIPPWSVSAVAQAAATLAVGPVNWNSRRTTASADQPVKEDISSCASNEEGTEAGRCRQRIRLRRAPCRWN